MLASPGLYMFMINDGFEFVVFIDIAVASLKGSAIGVICEGGIKLLLVYITAHGWVSVVLVGVVSVHAGFVGDPFFLSQNCSCSSRIAYCFRFGSLSMQWFLSLCLCRLFCSIFS